MEAFVIRILEEGFVYIKTPVSPVALLPLPHASSCSCLVLALVPAPGPALFSFVPLVPLVGLLYLRMEVSCPRPISLSHYRSD